MNGAAGAVTAARALGSRGTAEGRVPASWDSRFGAPLSRTVRTAPLAARLADDLVGQWPAASRRRWRGLERQFSERTRCVDANERAFVDRLL